jgi:predicted nucleic acid-binding protein
VKVFLDANVLFSASLPGSRMGRFLEILRARAELVTSQAALDEATRNVERKVTDAPPAAKNLENLTRKLNFTPLVAELPGVELVEKDRHILGAAVASQCTHLLTGDERHFKHLYGRTVGGVKVVHAKLLAEEIGVK